MTRKCLECGREWECTSSGTIWRWTTGDNIRYWINTCPSCGGKLGEVEEKREDECAG